MNLDQGPVLQDLMLHFVSIYIMPCIIDTGGVMNVYFREDEVRHSPFNTELNSSHVIVM